MNKEIMEKILQKIEAYNRIFIFRHIRNDGDCVGASKGLKAIIQLTWPEKEVYLMTRIPLRIWHSWARKTSPLTKPSTPMPWAS